MATHHDGSFDWPLKTCPLIDGELSYGEKKAYQFINKHTKQKFLATLMKGDDMQAEELTVEMAD